MENIKDFVSWDKEPAKVYNGEFGNDKWFYDGELNVCYNCLDRHPSNKTAILFNGNDNVTISYTYKECLMYVNQIANFLKKYDCKTVTIYLTMGPEAVFSALACARLGIPHNVVFGGYSAESLKIRMEDCKSDFLITQNVVLRGNKKIDFISKVKTVMDDRVLVFDNTGFKREMKYTSLVNLDDFSVEIEKYPKYFYWSDITKDSSYVKPVSVNSEHPLFYLYTSGSTGKPKGIIHSSGGYLSYAAYSTKTVFDIKENDIFCCTADIGWITGHTYVIYGPLSLGITTVVIEGNPTYPKTRMYDLVEKYKVTQFYTAPTLVRYLKKLNPELVENNYDFSNLRRLGSVGEPISKEAYLFYQKSFKTEKIVDTYWQTESGGILCALGDAPPESCGLPLPGIEAFVGPNQEFLVKKSWPGICRGIINSDRFKEYFIDNNYFTGDEASFDKFFYIKGRKDDIINVSGHKISTSEVESACSKFVNESAVVAIPHPLKGSQIILFITSNNLEVSDEIVKRIGSLARPEKIYVVASLPKTETGKIMRRVLRDLLLNKELGDLSTCSNKDSIEQIKNVIKNSK